MLAGSRRGRAFEVMPLGTHSVSIYDVTSVVLVIEETEGNERGEDAASGSSQSGSDGLLTYITS